MQNKRKQALLSLSEKLAVTWKCLDLLDLALTHTSFANEQKSPQPLAHNQRLEFLGDAVLSVVVSTHIYKKYEAMDEGELSKLRAFLVCEGTLAKLAKENHLGEYLLLGRGEQHLSGEENPSILADAFEAVVGACYLDQGLQAATALLHRLLISKIPRLTKAGFDLDYKTRYQEELQKKGAVEIIYQELEITGPAHARNFVMSVLVGGVEKGRGQGHTKKEAEQQAARRALEALK